MVPFQEVKVESVVPFQELGASYTFCCVAINRVGNDSDKFHSVTITSKIQTGSLGGGGGGGWVEFGGPICLYIYPYCLAREVKDSTSLLSSQAVGGFGIWQS